MDRQVSGMAGPALPAPGTVAVWRIPLAQPPEVVTACRSVLTPEEGARADRFRFEPPRRRFVVTRSALRQILGAALKTPPAALALAFGPQGKPYLPDVPWLHFNVSHSHDEALCALTSLGPVGIDIEHIRPLSDADAIARHKFAPEEYEAWLALPEDRRLAGFFACWSRKEAFIKATGEGLRRSLQDFVVTLQPEAPARLLTIHSAPEEVAAWSFLPVACPADYAAALLVRGMAEGTSSGTWQPPESPAALM